MLTSSNKETEILVVEEAKGSRRALVNDQLLDIIGVQVDQTHNDAQIGHKGAVSKLANVAHKGRWNQDDKEDRDPDNLVQIGTSETVDHNRKLLGKKDTITAKRTRRRKIGETTLVTYICR